MKKNNNKKKRLKSLIYEKKNSNIIHSIWTNIDIESRLQHVIWMDHYKLDLREGLIIIIYMIEDMADLL